MSNLFERKKIDGNSIRNIKELITNQFKLSENTTLAVAELRWHEPGCPPEETVITARYEDGSIKNWSPTWSPSTDRKSQPIVSPTKLCP